MRAPVLRATLAVLWLLPSSARAQTLSLTESEALARLSPESPRVRAIRVGRRRRAGRRACGGPLAESARDLRPRGRARHRPNT